MNEKETFIFMVKCKIRGAWLKVKEVFWKFVNGCKEMIVNRPEIFMAIIGFVSLIIEKVFSIFKTKKVSKNNDELRELKENYFYDRRCGHYVEAKRKLKGQELSELDRRYRNGESYTDILRSMRLLK